MRKSINNIKPISNRGLKYILFSILIVLVVLFSYSKLYNLKIEKEVSALKKTGQENLGIIIETSLGSIQLELYVDKAPQTVANFLSYVDSGFYNGTIFHRVIPDFMIQGGGFNSDLEGKPTFPPIKNEATNGLSNIRGTIAMARTPIIDSATSQFYINIVDNPHLDHINNTADGFGYCVFGWVTRGMEIVDQISKIPTGMDRGFYDLPLEEVKIISVEIIN
jgi:cyclophilin family peptidyl-prolyl cis-trans isomerase